jgi:hypothetical protein
MAEDKSAESGRMGSSDKIGNISSEAKDHPPGEKEKGGMGHDGGDRNMTTGKLVSQSGLPHKHEAKKMPHEHFVDKMAGSLSGDCY